MACMVLASSQFTWQRFRKTSMHCLNVVWKRCRMGLCLYVDLCFHASSLLCLHDFWHAIPTSFYIFMFIFIIYRNTYKDSFNLSAIVSWSQTLTRKPLFKCLALWNYICNIINQSCINETAISPSHRSRTQSGSSSTTHLLQIPTVQCM